MILFLYFLLLIKYTKCNFFFYIICTQFEIIFKLCMHCKRERKEMSENICPTPKTVWFDDGLCVQGLSSRASLE